MIRLWPGTLCLVMWAMGLNACEDNPQSNDDSAKMQDKARSPSDRFVAAKTTYDDAREALRTVIAELKKKNEKLLSSNKQLADAFETSDRAADALLKAAELLVEADPNSRLAFEAFNTIVNVGTPSAAVLKLLTKHHASNPKIGELVSKLRGMRTSEELILLLKQVIEKNPNHDARGVATFTLACIKMRDNPDEAEFQFKIVMLDFKDVKLFNSTLGARAEAIMFQKKHLQIGSVVPDIEGEDVDGTKFKLSDYRGKVVFLDFWGHW